VLVCIEYNSNQKAARNSIMANGLKRGRLLLETKCQNMLFLMLSLSN